MPQVKAKAKAKQNPINEIIIKEEKIPDPTPPPSPPSPPALERQPKKRNPPHYKLKMSILNTLKEQYKVDNEIINQISELFHIHTHVIDTFKI